MIDKKKIRILYFGTPYISARVLELLIKNNYNIIGVVAQCDKEYDRKKNLLAVPTKLIATKYNLPIYQKEKIKLDYEFVKDLNVDIILTLAYGQIMPGELLKIPKYGSFNLHGSLLPKYRGASPIQQSLINGDKETGITLMEMIDKMDAGKIYYQEKVKIDEEDNFSTLVEKLIDAAYNSFDKGISDVINNINKGQEQDETLVSFTKKINNEFEHIDFNLSSNQINNNLRAISDITGGYFIFNNVKYKIYKIIPYKISLPYEKGTIIKYDKNGFCITTSDGYIEILKIQKPGKNIMDFKSFYNGNQKLFKVGELVY